MLTILALAAVAGVALAAWWFWRHPAVATVATGGEGVPVEVPSGQRVSYLDTIQNIPSEGLVYRFRFVAPGIARQGGGFGKEAAQADMQWLCDNFALSRIPETGPQPSQVVISMSDRPVKFGNASPDVTQFFEGYRIEDGKCVWELF